MMIAALAKAARSLGRPDLAAAATRAVDFIGAQLWRDGRLKATDKDGRARFAGYLDDYAFLAAGLIELLQCRWRSEDLHFARGLADALLAHFADPRGGFFFTADDHEQLIHRPKPLADEAIPAGNAVAALALSNLGHLLGEARYLDAAEAALRAAFESIDRYPEAHATFLCALMRQLAPPELVILRGKIDAIREWQARAQSGYHPQRLTFAIPDDAEGLSGLLATRNATAAPVAYVCSGTECRAPIDVLEELTATLDT
jgi:uncharacterized protein YyaL (SSP411 family)